MHTKPSHHVLFMSSFESFPSSPLLPSSSSLPTRSWLSTLSSSPSSSSPSPTPSPTPPPSPPPGTAVSPGTAVKPYAERLLVVRQRLDASLSPSSYYPAPGYRLLSPVLGLLFYNADGAQLRIASITRPISIDFSESVRSALSGDIAGIVRLSELAAGGKVYLGYKEEHYGFLVEEGVRGRTPAVKRWKMAVGGAVVRVVLLLLLLTAMVKKKKGRVRMAETERRAYEEEALQVSMVGHVRAPVA